MTTTETTSAESAAIANFEVRGVPFKVDVAGMPHAPEANPYFRLAQRGMLYEPVMMYCTAQILSKETDPAYLDVGSRMGYYAAFAAAFIGRGDRVHAVEADPAYAPRTSRSCAVSGYPDVTVHEVILSDVEETAGIDGKRGVVYDGTGAQAVTTITADALCAKHGFAPTVVKVDVHGCEGKVLLGMERVLRESVNFLLLELHDAFRLDHYSPGVDRYQILSFLEELGFTLFHVAGHEMPIPFARDEGFTYRPLKGRDVFFDRVSGIVFLVASKNPDLASVLGPSVDDPRLM